MEGFGLEGRSRRRSWQKGVIADYLAQGVNLREAMELAALNGALVDEAVVHNKITTAGLQLVGDILIGDDDSSLTYHAIGTSNTTPAAADTELGAEVERKQFSLRERAGAVLTYSVFYAADECTYAIAECGVFGGDDVSAVADSGELFSHYLETKDNSDGDFDLTFEYEVTISEVVS